MIYLSICLCCLWLLSSLSYRCLSLGALPSCVGLFLGTWISLLLFSPAVMSDSLWPHGLQHTKRCCPSLSSRVCSNSCPLGQQCHPTISSAVAPFSSALSLYKHHALRIRWPKYWSFRFSISPSTEYSGLSSFRIYWFNLAVQETLKSLLQSHSLKASVLQYSVYFMVHIFTWLLEKP